MKRSNSSLRFISLLMLLVFLLCVINVLVAGVFHIHARSLTNFDGYISSVATVNQTVYASRGNIYDANGQVVAQDVETYDIICYLDKSRVANKNTIAYVDDPLYAATVLSPILDMEVEDIYYYLTANPDLYQTELGPKGRNLSEETVNKIKEIPDLHGIGFRKSYRRNYPQGKDFAPYLVGFAQSDDSGQLVGKMGLEAYLNDELTGTNGKHVYQQSKNGYILEGMYEKEVPAVDGNDVYLTIDSSIQEALETAFDDVEEENNASKAWGAVVEISTGKILGWGQTPSFDPNVLDIEDYNNYGSQFAYEPGSVMKSFIYATAMDLGTYKGSDTFNSEPYCYLSSGSEPYRSYGNAYGCISNAGNKVWGNIELDYGLILSSNVATSTLLSDYVGTGNYLNYLRNFGFFEKVDTDNIPEITGTLNYTYPSEKLALTYGQGSSVTMLQLLQAYTAIFGNGEMVKPYYIDHIVDPNTNEIVYQAERTVVSTPIKESTAKQMQALLERVVSDPKGTAKFYSVDEVNIMAKTGTSEIAVDGSYGSSDSITSVMLAFPADNPQYMIYFAYISPYDYYNHTYSTPVKNLIRRVAILTNVGYNLSDNQINHSVTRNSMPALINMPSAEAYNLLSDEYDVILIGNGNTIIDQYPLAGDDAYTGQKVFLTTNSSFVSCPDFKGWSRKEISEYWYCSNIPITLTGYGIVTEQSVSPGTPIDANTEIIVSLSDIHPVKNDDSVLDDSGE